jgi:uncharacterized protein involved in exopolysaccharide biosynthesis
MANVVEYIAVLARNKRLIVRFVGISILVGIILLFFVLPRWYKAVAVIMPPQQKNALGLLSSITRATSSLRTLGLGGSADDLSQFQAILGSRRVMEAVVTHFGLKSVYGVESMEKAIKSLEDNVAFSPGKEDVSVEITVFDTDAKRAAEMANYLVDALNAAYLDMSTTEARGNREFLERRYNQNVADLKNAEEDLRNLQQRYGIYSVSDQIKAAVQTAAVLESQVRLKQIQLDILTNTTSEDNPGRQSAEIELKEIKKQLYLMNNGGAYGDASVVFPAFKDAPEIGMEYVRRFRDVEIQNKLMELILPLYEQAKIEEQKTTASVVVLDKAVPAERPAKPKRVLNLILIAFVSFIAAYFLALFVEMLRRVNNGQVPEVSENLKFIRRELSIKRLFK